jgi:NADP-dependent 3-hydroxy acid dehydrogenase YdfG
MRIEKGMVVFITGGASGLGEATARMCFSKGASVAIADQDEDRMELLAKELVGLAWFKCDVTVEEQV